MAQPLPAVSYSTTILDFFGEPAVLVPDRLLPSPQRVYLTGTINMHAFEAVAEPWRDGQHMVAIPREVMRSLWISDNGEVEMVFHASQTIPQPTLPAELQRTFKDNPDYRQAFEGLSRSDQMQYIHWIASATSKGIKHHRIEQVVHHVRRLLNLPFASNTLPSYLKPPIPPNLQ
jgi:hypothetical protein